MHVVSIKRVWKDDSNHTKYTKSPKIQQNLFFRKMAANVLRKEGDESRVYDDEFDYSNSCTQQKPSNETDETDMNIFLPKQRYLYRCV